MCCNSWGRKELDTTERLNCTELKLIERKYDIENQKQVEMRKDRIWKTNLTLCTDFA